MRSLKFSGVEFNIYQWIIFICLIAVFLNSGCGKKTLPVPPEIARPARVDDLRYSLNMDSVSLSWTAPKFTESGEKLVKIKGFELLKAMIPETDYCPDCPVVYSESFKISGDFDLTFKKERNFTFDDFDLLGYESHPHIAAPVSV